MKNLALTHRGSRGKYLVEFSVENQKFTLDTECETKAQVKWFHRMLRKALKTLVETNQK